MEILFLLVPVALILIGLAIKLLFWAVKDGQYDDLDTEGRRILFDDPPAPPKAPETDPLSGRQTPPTVQSNRQTTADRKD